MKLNLLVLMSATILMSNTIYACEIEQKRSVQRGLNKGVAGVCSNNGHKIECFNVGENSGGLSCKGPEGSFSGANLKNLIFSVCGCGTDDRNAEFQQQIDQQLE
ncbi:MAG: hypothetical protein DRQ62_00160 [Gammaproteobacteria bacterium]|nr:MAG: hypothetical protein DRQ62_00160 [Gammaproteobacteria bacterium]